jgi:hypothetical protein
VATLFRFDGSVWNSDLPEMSVPRQGLGGVFTLGSIFAIGGHTRSATTNVIT